MRPHEYDVHNYVPVCVSRSILCPGVRLWLFMYDVSPGNFVTFVPAFLSRPPVTSSLSHGSGNNVMKEIQIQTFCDT